MSSLAFPGFVLFILLLFVGIYLCLFGLPGTGLIYVSVLAYAFLTDFAQIGWKALLLLLAVAIFAEAMDVWIESGSVHKAPITRQSLWGAFLGGGVGMIILTPFLGGPGIWMGFFLGAMSGLLLMEQVRQANLKIPRQATGRALLGMVGQKILKGFLAIVMIFIALACIYS